VSSLDPVLARGLSAIEPYLDDVVIAGGWVPHIYELLYDALKAGRSPRTRDIDLAVRRSVPVKGTTLDKMLRAAGFECRFHSLDTPPVTKYVASDGAENLEIEFITDAPGSSEAAVHVQQDVTAQGLHYVGLLLENPWPVDLGALTDGAYSRTVNVPAPGAFVVHKALVFKDRSDPVKKEKDLYYAFFVFEAFPDWRGAIAAQMERLAQEHTSWFRKCLRSLKAIYADADSAGVDALLNQRPPTAYAMLDDEQFRQYAFSVMSELIAVMDNALVLGARG